MTSHVDPALVEMFAAEVETHMAALNDGLLALEQDPTRGERFEGLMRAAHSIKGAAKLVGLQAAVEIAHVIEDCFVAAREGRLAMSSGLVDVLLEGVDLLGRAAQYEAPPELRITEPQIAATVGRILQASQATPASGRERQQAKAHASHQLPAVVDERWVVEHHRELARQLKQENAIEFDLRQVTQIDPIGLALIAHLAASADPHGLRLRGAPASLNPLLDAAGLRRHSTTGTEG